MQARALRVVADLYFCTWDFLKLLDCLNICRSHIRSSDNAQFSSVLSKCAQLLNNKPQPTPFDKGNKHIDSICGRNFLF